MRVTGEFPDGKHVTCYYFRVARRTKRRLVPYLQFVDHFLLEGSKDDLSLTRLETVDHRRNGTNVVCKREQN